MLTKQHRQEAICKAYVRAIAAQAGLICSEPEGDYGIDLCLRAIRSRGPRLADVGGQLDLQLKSTTRAHVSDSAVLFDLEKKTTMTCEKQGDNVPRILVVLLMPLDENQWISQSPGELVLRGGGYWLSLEGYPSTSAAKTVRNYDSSEQFVLCPTQFYGLMASMRERKVDEVSQSLDRSTVADVWSEAAQVITWSSTAETHGGLTDIVALCRPKGRQEFADRTSTPAEQARDYSRE